MKKTLTFCHILCLILMLLVGCSRKGTADSAITPTENVIPAGTAAQETEITTKESCEETEEVPAEEFTVETTTPARPKWSYSEEPSATIPTDTQPPETTVPPATESTQPPETTVPPATESTQLPETTVPPATESTQPPETTAPPAAESPQPPAIVPPPADSESSNELPFVPA